MQGLTAVFLLALSSVLPLPLQAQPTVQWASRLIGFSTEYSRKASSASQVLGAPDVWPGFGASDVAWAPSRPNSAMDEFVRVGFQTPMAIQQVAIAESLNPGCIYKVIAYDEQGQKHELFEDRQQAQRSFYPGSRLFSVKLDATTPYRVAEIKLVLRTSRVEGMCQIDAIGLSDSPDKIRPAIRMVEADLFPVQAENLGPNVNSASPDMLPMISPDGRTLYFARKLHPENSGTDLRDDIWVSSLDDNGEWSQAQNIGAPLNNEHHNFVSWISPDGRQMVLPHDYGRREIGAEFRVSNSMLRQGNWAFPQVMNVPELYNRSQFTCIHLNPEGTVMLLALERDEGLGGLDLYVSFARGRDSWTVPKPLGPTINTAGMEGSVFLAADGRSLYFASNGHPGFGGYDMFLSRRLDDTWTQWSAPLNLGPHINTERDEYYYSLPASGEYAYFSSEQGGYGGADLFRIRLPQSARPDPVTLLHASVINQQTGEPISAQLRFNEVQVQAQPGEGSSTLVQPRDDSPDIVIAEADGYFPQGLDLDAGPGEDPTWMDVDPDMQGSKDLQDVDPNPTAPPAQSGSPIQTATPFQTATPEPTLQAPEPALVYRELDANLALVPLAVGNLVRLNGVYFSANKSFLLKESQVELDVVAQYLRANPGLLVEVGGHTNGLPPEAFCLELSEARAKAVVQYLRERGVKQEQLQWKGYGKTLPIGDNATLEGRKQNQRVELKLLAVP